MRTAGIRSEVRIQFILIRKLEWRLVGDGFLSSYLMHKICSCPELIKNPKIKTHKTTTLPFHMGVKFRKEGIWQQSAEENIYIKEEVTGDREKLHNEELYSLYSSNMMLNEGK
jgi:hypothetical protein